MHIKIDTKIDEFVEVTKTCLVEDFFNVNQSAWKVCYKYDNVLSQVLHNRHHAYHPSKNSGDASPYKKIETKQEVSGSKQELEIEDLYDSATEDDVKKKKDANNFKVKDSNRLSIGSKSSQTSSSHDTEDGKTALSKKKSRPKKYTSSISGDSVGGSSYCSCSSYPNSYDPSLYSYRSDKYNWFAWDISQEF